MHGIEAIIERQLHNWDRIRATLGREASVTEVRETVPNLPVITISRQPGAGGRTVAQLLADQLGLELVGYSLIDEVARNRKLQKKVADSLDERARDAIELLVEGLLRGRYVDHEEYARATAKAIRTLATRGGVIFLGRAAAVVLGDKADLNVRLVAGEAFRAKRLMEYEHLGEREAARAAVQRDKERIAYARKLYRVDINDPLLYDLVINTERIPPQRAVTVITAALTARGVLWNCGAQSNEAR